MKNNKSYQYGKVNNHVHTKGGKGIGQHELGTILHCDPSSKFYLTLTQQNIIFCVSIFVFLYDLFDLLTANITFLNRYLFS